MNEWWAGLELRERRLILGGGVVVVLLLITYVPAIPMSLVNLFYG